MEKMIAYCGLTCTECPAYIATKNGDEEALAKLADQWGAEYDAPLTIEDCRCNGCLAAEGPWMSHCGECKIRECGRARQVGSCADCSEYACEKLQEFFGVVPDARATLDGLRIGR